MAPYRSLLVVLGICTLFLASGFREHGGDRLEKAVVLDTLPVLNQKVLEFVKENMKKKVGRGECWDLAAGALEHAGAEWDGKYEFGSTIDPEEEEVLPGDIVQFENVVTRDNSGNVLREERMIKHTAIIYRVIADGVYDLAHQNTDLTGRKVGISRFLLGSVVRGKVKMYRPSA